MLASRAMRPAIQPCEVHLDGGERDLERLANSFTAEVTPVGRNARRLFMDNEWAEGYALSVGLPFGMRMMVQELNGRVPLRLPIRHAPTALEFSFCRGKGVSVRTAQGQALTVSGAQMRVGRVNETTLLEYEAEAGASDHSVHLTLTREALMELLGQESIPSVVSGLISSPGPLNFFETRMDGALMALTDEVFDISETLSGSVPGGGLLYLHAKAMELIALAVDRASTISVDSPALAEGDVKRLRQAVVILKDNMDNPPSVAELARRVGLGEKRFKAGFKLLFGSPVMSYHRRLRMERARELLVARAHNVTEVASLIGYANPSKFAAAYRREFGESPRFALTGTA